MPDTVTDKQVEQAEARNEKLREQIAEERQAIANETLARENEYRQALLGTEEDRLKAELSALREQRKAAAKIVDQTIETIGAEPVVPPEPVSVNDEKEK